MRACVRCEHAFAVTSTLVRAPQAKGLYQLPGIGDKRVAKKQVVAALLAETSQEWMISAQASMMCGLTLTTVYATLGHEAMLHGLRQTEAEVIFMDFGLFDTLRDEVLAKCPALRHVVFIGKDLIPFESSAPGHKPFPTPPQAAEIPAIGQAHCTTLDNVILHGRQANVNLTAVAPTPQDVAMIMCVPVPDPCTPVVSRAHLWCAWGASDQDQ